MPTDTHSLPDHSFMDFLMCLGGIYLYICTCRSSVRTYRDSRACAVVNALNTTKPRLSSGSELKDERHMSTAATSENEGTLTAD